MAANRVPPQSVEAEQAVLGGLMLAPDSWSLVCDMLEARDFFRRDHGLIWSAIKALAEDDKPFDAVTLAEWFESQGMAEQVAGGAYIVELASTTPSAANIRAYAEIVRDKAQLRELIEVGNRAVALGFNPAGRNTTELLNEVHRDVSRLSGARQTLVTRSMRDIGRTWLENLEAMYHSPDTAHGLLTPWSGLNKITNGYYDGDLVITAGRPGMGKSAAAINTVMSAALRGIKCMYFSLEMTDVSIFNRMVSTLSGVPLEWMRRPNEATEEEWYWTRIAEAVRRLRAAPIVIDQSAGLTTDAIVARATRESMRGELRLVVVDHMHLIQLPKREKGSTELGDVTGAFKKLAKTLGCPVNSLAQLNRGLESRQDKRPVMSDLRESGSIEQDADTIIFYYRNDYYAKLDDPNAATDNILEMIVAKQREGSTGTAYTRADLGRSLIEDMPDGWTPPPKQVAQATTARGRGYAPLRAVEPF